MQVPTEAQRPVQPQRTLLKRFVMLERSRNDMLLAATQARDAAHAEAIRNYQPRVLSFGEAMMDSWRRMSEEIKEFFVSQAFVGPVVFVLSVAYGSLVSTAFGLFNCLPFTIEGRRFM